jgi:pimeloyl-ACP methyl ester carboxylesterase
MSILDALLIFTALTSALWWAVSRHRRPAVRQDEQSQPDRGGNLPSRSGHVGCVVLGSIGIGVVLGVVLDVLVSGGSCETVILGFALLSIASGCAALVVLSTRRTDQPQRWPVIPAFAFGLGGIAILIADPSSRVLGLLGWIWPALLMVLVVGMFRGSRRSLRNWSRRALLYPAFVLLVLVALGGAFETVVEAARSNSPPPGGRTYLVAGHRLYLRCAGSGSPTVILFNGLGERTPSWAWVQGDVARRTRVCVFDRAGQGWSGDGVGGQDAHRLSTDARGLLAAAKVRGPYVLAGHSVGGTYALAYAMDYPKDVAGVALIDSATPYQFDLPTYPSFYSMWRRGQALLPTLGRAGIPRVFSLVTGGSSLPSDASRQASEFSSSPRELRADRIEFAELRTIFRQDKALTNLGGKPLFVLTADVGEQPGWPAAQAKLATLSADRVHQTTHGATHTALLEDEKFAAVSARAIDAVVRSVRTNAPLSR